MTTLIKLTVANGNAFWVNPRYIASVTVYDGETRIFVANDTYPTVVKETPEEIIQKISIIKE